MLLLCGKHDDETQARRQNTRYVTFPPPTHTHTHTQTHTIAFVMWPRPLPLWYISVQPPHRPHFPPAVAVYNKTFIASCHAQACPSSSVRCDCLLLSCHTPHQILFHQRANTPPPPLHSCSSCGTSKYNAYAALNSQQDRQKKLSTSICQTQESWRWIDVQMSYGSSWQLIDQLSLNFIGIS